MRCTLFPLVSLVFGLFMVCAWTGARAQLKIVQVKAGVFGAPGPDIAGLSTGLDLVIGNKPISGYLSYDRLDEFVIFSEPWRINHISAGLFAERRSDRRRIYAGIAPSLAFGTQGRGPGADDIVLFATPGGVMQAGIQHCFTKWSVGLDGSVKLNGELVAYTVQATVGVNLRNRDR